MKLSDVVAHSGLAFFAEVALAIFFIAFITVLFELMRRAKEEDEQHAALALADDVAKAKQP